MTSRPGVVPSTLVYACTAYFLLSHRQFSPFLNYLQPSQAKPKCKLREETCAVRKLTSPCLLAIPAFDRIPGLNNIFLKYNRGICFANNFAVRLTALIDYTKD